MTTTPFRVTAIVTTYKSARFIEGCLRDLEAQTLFQKRELEIVVVISGSPENEEDIVRAFAARYPSQVVYMVTERETMYQAWNRAIKIARGTYITNSNTDDRHEPTACERLAHHLDTHAEIDLAYGNCYVSTQENETYQENDKKTLYRFPQYFAPNAPLHYQFGPQPLWRSSLHAQIGYFSETLRAAGDYDFNLRFAVAGCKAQRIEGPPTGLYLAHAQAISFKDSTITKETEELYAQYRTPEAVLSCYQAAGVIPTNQGDVSAIFTDFAVRALEYFPPWFSGGAHREVVLAKQFLAHALTAQPTYPAALVNLALCEAADGDIVRAQELLGRALEHDGNRAIIESNRSALTPGNANSGMFTLYPSGLTLASQREISLL